MKQRIVPFLLFAALLALAACPNPADSGEEEIKTEQETPRREAPAVWRVSFDKNGGDIGAEPAARAVRPPATTVETLPLEPLRAGHIFTGWNTRAGGDGEPFGPESPVTEDITVYAQWQPLSPNARVVSFDANGGDRAANPASRAVEPPANTIDQLPDPPARTGWGFTGWNTQADGLGQPYNAATPVTEDITVYAQWQAAFTVSYNLNGGDGPAPAQQILTPPLTTVDRSPLVPSRAGWVFAGWNTQSGGNGQPFTRKTPVTADITVYAQWATPTPSNHLTRTLVSISGGTVSASIGDTGSRTPGPFKDAGDHPVTVDSFTLGATEVCYELWYQVYRWALDHGYSFASPGQEGRNGLPGEHPTAGRYEPAIAMLWRDAVVWCNAYSEMEGKTPVYYEDPGFQTVLRIAESGYEKGTGMGRAEHGYAMPGAKGYRLPTREEWEFAARGGNPSATAWNYAYAGSDTLDTVAWHKGNAGDVTHDVGGKAANALGLYDMSGNAAEWCWGGMPSPGSGTITQIQQACRGGSFLDAPAANALNTANYAGLSALIRVGVGATRSYVPYGGFRVAARP